MHALDGTSESFSFAKYLQSNPTTVPTEVVLIDHPLDADYSVSGRITGTVKADYQDKEGTIDSWRDVFLLLAWFPVVMVIAPLAPVIKDGVLGRTDEYFYKWDQTGAFVLRRRGRQIDEFAIHSVGERKEKAPATHLRGFVNADMWKQLAAQVEQRIQADVAARQSRPVAQAVEGGVE